MLLVLVFLLKILFAEPRVFCQDINAMDWQPLGLPCPITCSTIKTAVDRLKQADYDYIIQYNNRNYINMSEWELHHIRQDLKNNSYNRRINSLPANERKHIKLYQTYHRLLSNENFEHALKKEAREMTAELNKICSSKASKDLSKKKVNIKCKRKLNKRPEILEKFTKFLNVYADPKYPFNEKMVGVILQKLEGNMGLRYGVFGYKRILAYLRQELKYHKMQSRTNDARIIKLQSKNCLTIHLPGCYCKIGYVEDHGQCVKPEDCITNRAFTEYLERIILH